MTTAPSPATDELAKLIPRNPAAPSVSEDEDDCAFCRAVNAAAPVSEPAYTKADDLLHTIGGVEHPDAASGEGLIARLEQTARDLGEHRQTHVEWHDWLAADPSRESVNPQAGSAEFHKGVTADYDRHLANITEAIRRLTTTGQGDVERLVEAAKELADDVSDRFDLESPSTNPGMKAAVAGVRAALAPFGQQQEGQG